MHSFGIKWNSIPDNKKNIDAECKVCAFRNALLTTQGSERNLSCEIIQIKMNEIGIYRKISYLQVCIYWVYDIKKTQAIQE